MNQCEQSLLAERIMSVGSENKTRLSAATEQAQRVSTGDEALG